ncbi:hypothetical protein H4R33_004758 [Dimargaris cristalligena]|uniref:Uncharacterized protein n=1 Tax=Dimargaris cristalligena TaxID=215637 RepID=A0A4P9ZJL9_9FUNG|nr:hypothetical protein H4R33_004758 [Dimargaris cristalligena]RKP33446.1 hypothetical protein BJ085DRAFT_28209 [Dimargaris cristalligena]|eukprot:RKP33446.1 hypothetical protein BJ085DRAFT_28209 [Dimargaris cristalligena]
MSNRNGPYYFNNSSRSNWQNSHNRQSGSGSSSLGAQPSSDVGNPTSSIYNAPVSSVYNAPSSTYSQAPASSNITQSPYVNSHLPPSDLSSYDPPTNSHPSFPHLSNPFLSDTGIPGFPRSDSSLSQKPQYGAPFSPINKSTGQIEEGYGSDSFNASGHRYTESMNAPTIVHIRQSYSQSSAQPVRPTSATYPPFYSNHSSAQMARPSSVSTATTQFGNWSFQDSSSGDKSDQDDN